MWIDKAKWTEYNEVGDNVVQGKFELQGTFTREEWDKIKVGFIAMGLMQLGGHRPERTSPSRQEFVAAIQDVASGRNFEAIKQLRDKYNIPQEKTLTLKDTQ
jgi:hypothetical protein